MSLSDKPITAVNSNDLQTLVDEKEPESKSVEYKRTLPGKSDRERTEYLADVSAFANGSGGYLIYGIVENKGVPTQIAGIEDINPDSERRRLEEMARDGIRPPIVGLETAVVPLSNGNMAILIRIPKSWNPPHQVTYQKHFKFYGRDSNGKYQLDVDELRNIFVMSEGITEKTQKFRADRIIKIGCDEIPTTLAPGGRIVTHILPLAAFASLPGSDVRSLVNEQNLLGSVAGELEHSRFNLDGIVAWSKFGYVQVFRKGCIEAVRVFSSDPLPAVDFESRIFSQIDNGYKILQRLSVACPIVISVSFLGMRGWRIGVSSAYVQDRLDVFDRDPLLLPEILVENFEETSVRQARPLIDAVWNSAGWPGSPHYDQKGEWDPKRW